MIFKLIKSLPNSARSISNRIKHLSYNHLFSNQITKQPPLKLITRTFNTKPKASVSQNSTFSRYSTIFVFGLLSYLVYDNSDKIKGYFITKKHTDGADDPTLEFDLNEIYERCAIQFLTDRKVYIFIIF
jgi:hypothetical protein